MCRVHVPRLPRARARPRASTAFGRRRSSRSAAARRGLPSPCRVAGKCSRSCWRRAATAARIGILPRQFAGLHELQGGERTTFAFVMCCGPRHRVRGAARVGAVAAARFGRRRIAPARGQLGAAGGRLADGPRGLRRARQPGVIDGDDIFRQRREAIDEYGWRNFGEIYADHEAVSRGRRADGLALQQSVRRHRRLRHAVPAHRRSAAGGRLMDELAGHVADIDLYHTQPRPRGLQRRLFLAHPALLDRPAPPRIAPIRRASGTSRRRAVGRAQLHHRPAAALLPDRLRALARGRDSTGRLGARHGRRPQVAVSLDRSPRHGTGQRHALARLPRPRPRRRQLDQRAARRASAHRRRRAISRRPTRCSRRCIHPDDDPDALDLLDAENRWSYTVFLQALGKYLEHRADRGLVDAHYAYARAVLLKYAEWMSANERPYLDSPERLEYPDRDLGGAGHPQGGRVRVRRAPCGR